MLRKCNNLMTQADYGTLLRNLAQIIFSKTFFIFQNSITADKNKFSRLLHTWGVFVRIQNEMQLL